MEKSDPLSFLNGKIDIIKPGLERIKYLADALGNPQNSYRTIHVGGTNGKGSTCHVIYSILRNQGYGVGLYTSPHLNIFNERIVVDGREITDSAISDFINMIKPVLETMEKIPGIGPPSYFEVTTALAFEYFKKKKVDYVVVEVGLGGRFDATNIVEPVVSIITNISVDHTEFLGDEIHEIAFEKAGIIKHGIPVVTSGENPIALEVIEKKAGEIGSPVVVMHKEMIIRERMAINGQHFSLLAPDFRYNDLFIPMLGEFQVMNASLAICAVEMMKKAGIEIGEGSIRGGLSTTWVPGRVELFDGKPGILMDCAHNHSGFIALNHILEEKIFHGRKKVLLFSMLNNKDISNSLNSIRGPVDKVIITSLKTKRGASRDVLVQGAAKAGMDFVFIHDAETAFEMSKKEAGENGMVIVAGSFYLVGEVRKIIDIP